MSLAFVGMRQLRKSFASSRGQFPESSVSKAFFGTRAIFKIFLVWVLFWAHVPGVSALQSSPIVQTSITNGSIVLAWAGHKSSYELQGGEGMISGATQRWEILVFSPGKGPLRAKIFRDMGSNVHSNYRLK